MRAYLCPLTWPKAQLLELLQGTNLYSLVKERSAAVESALDSLPLPADMKDAVTTDVSRGVWKSSLFFLKKKLFGGVGMG